LSQISLPWQRGSVGENAIGSIQLRIPENPPIDAKISQIFFYTRRVIANCVPNFVAMATEVNQRKMRLAAFDGPSPKNPYRCKNLADISYTDRVIANFVPNFVAMATGVGRGKNAIGIIQWPIPQNPPVDAKISQISLTQADL